MDGEVEVLAVEDLNRLAWLGVDLDGLAVKMLVCPALSSFDVLVLRNLGLSFSCNRLIFSWSLFLSLGWGSWSSSLTSLISSSSFPLNLRVLIVVANNFSNVLEELSELHSPKFAISYVLILSDSIVVILDSSNLLFEVFNWGWLENKLVKVHSSFHGLAGIVLVSSTLWWR